MLYQGTIQNGSAKSSSYKKIKSKTQTNPSSIGEEPVSEKNIYKEIKDVISQIQIFYYLTSLGLASSLKIYNNTELKCACKVPC